MPWFGCALAYYGTEEMTTDRNKLLELAIKARFRTRNVEGDTVFECFPESLERFAALLQEQGEPSKQTITPEELATSVKAGNEWRVRSNADGEEKAEQKAAQPIHEQNARFAIDGAIAYGKMGIKKPPTDDHWLMEYWLIGQSLAAPAPQQEAAKRILEGGEHIGWILSDGTARYFGDPTDTEALNAAGLGMHTVQPAAAQAAPMPVAIPAPEDSILRMCGWEDWKPAGYINREIAEQRYRMVAAFVLDALTPQSQPAQPKSIADQIKDLKGLIAEEDSMQIKCALQDDLDDALDVLQPVQRKQEPNHPDAVRIVHEEAGRTLSKADFDLCLRIAKRAAQSAPSTAVPEITDAMCSAFHNAVPLLGDRDEIRIGLCAALAAAPSGDAKDAEMLDWLEAAMKKGKRLVFHKKHFSMFTSINYEYDVFPTVREAIAAAMQPNATADGGEA